MLKGDCRRVEERGSEKLLMKEERGMRVRGRRRLEESVAR